MGEENREFVRDRMSTFNTEQEVCDTLGITVEDILQMFEDKFNSYADREEC